MISDRLAATIYHHFGVPLDTHYRDHRSHPRPMIEPGDPMRELVKRTAA